MSRKDFLLIAKGLAVCRIELGNLCEDKHELRVSMNAWRDVVNQLKRELANSCPNFNPQKFIEECER
jgi:hypothetical protein